VAALLTIVLSHSRAPLSMKVSEANYGNEPWWPNFGLLKKYF